MSDQIKFGVTVLWASELFAASHLLHEAFAAMSEEPLDEQKLLAAYREALRASYVALHGIHEHPEKHLLVMNAEREKFVIRDTTIL